MIRIGVTGQDGFIGKYLYNTIGLFPGEFERIDFKKSLFEDPSALDGFVSRCDVIVHLAALNRHNDPDVIYQVNTGLVKTLISSFARTGCTPHILFSSSSQEERDNLYGKSKKDGRELLNQWAEKSGSLFTGMIIPNVFGPFGHPDYNSVVATFCHRLTHGEVPKIDVDGQLKLIFVGELVEIILNHIRSKTTGQALSIQHTREIKVSEILQLLEGYTDQYLKLGIIPLLRDSFEVNLFNTFRCYIDIRNINPVKYIQHTDQRGAFVEVIRLNLGGQVSFSTTKPGITRGNHFHTRKIERFSVIKGKALIQLRKIGTDDVMDFELDGNEPAYVDMPIWYTHNIKNTGEEELYTIFWINEFFDPSDADTFFENV